jgi:hypothetical protein
MDKLKESIRKKTRRTDGRCMRAICEDLSRTLRGWYGYFKHSKANVFERIDGYTRGRLRSILRKRRKKKGRGRGKDHQRWPNAYFTTMGLYSLRQAHQMARQSFLKVNHQLESRMREIRPFGSEGGAKPSSSLPLSTTLPFFAPIGYLDQADRPPARSDRLLV